MKFKGIAEDSTIHGIGSMFRHNNDASWKINVKFLPEQKKNYVDISQLHLLARRRVVNPSTQTKPAGYRSTITIERNQEWEVQLVESCPILGVSKYGNGKQLCFVFNSEGIKYYLPQFELARALFFSNAYFARLSQIPNGLLQEFDAALSESGDIGYVNILPTSTLPMNSRWNNATLHLLAWLLFDSNARNSFESIVRYQLQDGHESGVYRFWDFQFDPPYLDKTSIVVHGQLDKDIQTFFVYEINSVLNLNCTHPSEVVFTDPKYPMRSGKRRGFSSTSVFSDAEIELDEEHEPNSDLSPMLIDSPKVELQFTNPVNIKRIGKGKPNSTSSGDSDQGSSINLHGSVDASTRESSILGTIKPADYQGIEAIDENIVLSGNFLDSFNQVIERLKQMEGITHLFQSYSRLPGVKGYSKYRLNDGSSRYILIHYIQYNRDFFTLLEVDTSDGVGALSTLLLKPLSRLRSTAWEKELLDLEIELLKHSLNWSTEFLKNKYSNRYVRIRHSQTTRRGVLKDSDFIFNYWAERMYTAICSIAS